MFVITKASVYSVFLVGIKRDSCLDSYLITVIINFQRYNFVLLHLLLAYLQVQFGMLRCNTCDTSFLAKVSMGSSFK